MKNSSCRENKRSRQCLDGNGGCSNRSDRVARWKDKKRGTAHGPRIWQKPLIVGRFTREHAADGWKPHKRRINSANLLPDGLDTGSNSASGIGRSAKGRALPSHCQETFDTETSRTLPETNTAAGRRWFIVITISAAANCLKKSVQPFAISWPRCLTSNGLTSSLTSLNDSRNRTCPPRRGSRTKRRLFPSLSSSCFFLTFLWPFVPFAILIARLSLLFSFRHFSEVESLTADTFFFVKKLIYEETCREANRDINRNKWRCVRDTIYVRKLLVWKKYFVLWIMRHEHHVFFNIR